MAPKHFDILASTQATDTCSYFSGKLLHHVPGHEIGLERGILENTRLSEPRKVLIMNTKISLTRCRILSYQIKFSSDGTKVCPLGVRITLFNFG